MTTTGGPTPPDGLVVVDKATGWTSHDVVGRCRRLFGTRKVGHAGTLDPMATGVLLVGVGRATRLLGHLSLTDKAYDATIRLGQSTVTDDAEGEIVSESDAGGLTLDQIVDAVAQLVGTIQQRPSAVSAIKVDGRRSYARVRAGEDVQLPPRQVTVSRFDVVEVRPRGPVVDVDVHVECSSGTYVRALARDLGAALGAGGHLTALRRTRVGPFDVAESRSLESLEPDPVVAMVPLGTVARRCFPTLTVDTEQERAVRVGRALPLDVGDGRPTALLDADGALLALYERREDLARPVAVFVG